MFSIDLHFHTAPRSACSHMAPEAALAAAVRTGLDAVVLTEHHELWTPEELEPLRRKWPQLLVLAGAEINCEQGHFLVYGLNDLDGVARDMPAERLIELAHEAGGPSLRLIPTAGAGSREMRA